MTTPKKSDSKVQHEAEFVVGKVADKTELQQLYAPVEPPTPPKSKPKGGKSKHQSSLTQTHAFVFVSANASASLFIA